MTRPRLAYAFLVLVTFAIYGVFFANHVKGYAAGSDASGYMNNARLLEQRQLIIPRREIEGLSTEALPSFAYIPLGFIPKNIHDMVPTYAMGFPLLILGVSYVVGWDHAADVTLWLHAMFSLIILYCLSRTMGLSHPLAYLGALLLGGSSIFIFIGLVTYSDMPALTWCSLAVLTAWLGRHNAKWAVAAGAAFSLAVLIRPTDFLMILPISLVFGFAWKKWLAFILGGIPAAIFLAGVNLQLYGKILTTGYGDVGSLFSLEYIPLGILAYAKFLPIMLTPAVFAIGLVPMMLYRRMDRRLIVLTAWAAVIPGFYATYVVTHDGWISIRFLLPSFSGIIILMLLAIENICSRFSKKSRLAFGALFTASIVSWDVAWLDHFHIAANAPGDEAYAYSTIWAREHLPENSVVLTMATSGALLYYTKLTFVRYEQFDQSTFTAIERACADSSRPLYALLFPSELDDALKTRIPGRWSQIAKVEDVSIWQRIGP